jgi:hypothetical protein
MDIHELKNVAESIENVMLEHIANKRISNYYAEIKPDGSELDVYYMPIAPLKFIKVDLKVASKI